MAGYWHRRDMLRLGAGFGLTSLLAACDTTSFGLPGLAAPASAGVAGASPSLSPAAAGQHYGHGATRVALLLPLSGELAGAGQSLANAAQLAMSDIAAASKPGDNITLAILDTAGTEAGAAAAARSALDDKVGLILGSITGPEILAIAGVARPAHVPVIGFAADAGAASPGTFLMAVLPQGEVHRSLAYATAHGKKATAAIFPSTDFGRAQRAAFETVIASFGLTARSTFSFSSDAEMRNVIEGVGPQIRLGRVDSIFFPDRATAPQFATLLGRAGVPKTALMIGSASWTGDPAILASNALAGAVFPAVDGAGSKMLAADYDRRFGGTPDPRAIFAYSAVVLANTLARGKGRFAASALTGPSFSSRAGIFRFLGNGQGQFGLTMQQVTPGGAVQVDGPKF